MKKTRLYQIMTAGIFCMLLCCSPAVFSQVKIGNNPKSINKDAVVEMESTNKGMLLPRLALSSTTNAAPLSSFVQGMFVFNTATANDVTPGMYYSDGVKWIKVNASTASSTGVKKSLEIVSANGKTIFNTPEPITDINKISLYRNGVMISFTINGANSIAAEVPSVVGDEIRIIQLL
jgi:hypothetical protein